MPPRHDRKKTPSRRPWRCRRCFRKGLRRLPRRLRLHRHRRRFALFHQHSRRHPGRLLLRRFRRSQDRCQPHRREPSPGSSQRCLEGPERRRLRHRPPCRHRLLPRRDHRRLRHRCLRGCNRPPRRCHPRPRPREGASFRVFSEARIHPPPRPEAQSPASLRGCSAHPRQRHPIIQRDSHPRRRQSPRRKYRFRGNREPLLQFSLCRRRRQPQVTQRWRHPTRRSFRRQQGHLSCRRRRLQ